METFDFIARLYVALSLSATLCVADYVLYTGPFVTTPHEFLHSIASILEVIAFSAAVVAWIGVWANSAEWMPDRIKGSLGDNSNLFVPVISAVIAVGLLVYFGVSLNGEYAALLGSSKDSFTDPSLTASGLSPYDRLSALEKLEEEKRESDRMMPARTQ